MQQGTTLETLLTRDRLLVASSLVVLVGLAWLYMVHMAQEMPQSGMQMTMPHMHRWGLIDLLLLFIMWVVMMVAMMVPTAAPMLLLFATINRRKHAQAGPLVSTGAFLLGYLLVWTGFSAVIAVLQWGLHAAALLSPLMVSSSPTLGGVILVAAGICQWTALKSRCLQHCRSPLGFFMTEWREGQRGALLMGLQHGSYCVGCCWLLMAVLFVTGAMNLLWITAITMLVLVEKVVPRGPLVGRVAGLGLVFWGVSLLARVWLPV